MTISTQPNTSLQPCSLPRSAQEALLHRDSVPNRDLPGKRAVQAAGMWARYRTRLAVSASR